MIPNRDVKGPIGYLSTKVDSDPVFFYKFSPDEEDRLKTVFWVDSWSRWGQRKVVVRQGGILEAEDGRVEDEELGEDGVA
ncbi:hypothetical protein ACH5RR_023092 [Cinchona calisaya]|uniref:Uncharacterized protein n=1 Tax=Cinchona calisaya TaxID=153742 RepID=A0ABD2ZCY9_9GENT